MTMKTRNLLYIIVFSLSIINCQLSIAQAPDLDAALKVAKAMYPQVDSLDRVTSRLHYFDTNAPSHDQQEKLMEIYKAISNGYAVNSHYKTGYEAFSKYLSIKEKKLAAEKDAAIAKEKAQYDQKDKNDAAEVSTLEEQVKQLDGDTNGLITKRSLFKKIFSVIIAFLSLLFAYSLFRSGVKMKDLRNETQADRDKVMHNHRIALIGSFSDGLNATITRNFAKLKQELSGLLNHLTTDSDKIKKLKEKVADLLKDSQ